MTQFGHLLSILTLFRHLSILTLFGHLSILTLFGHLSILTLFGHLSILTLFGHLSILTLFGHLSILTLFRHISILTLFRHLSILTLFGHLSILTQFGHLSILTSAGSAYYFPKTMKLIENVLHVPCLSPSGGNGRYSRSIGNPCRLVWALFPRYWGLYQSSDFLSSCTVSVAPRRSSPRRLSASDCPMRPTPGSEHRTPEKKLNRQIQKWKNSRCSVIQKTFTQGTKRELRREKTWLPTDDYNLNSPLMRDKVDQLVSKLNSKFTCKERSSFSKHFSLTNLKGSAHFHQFAVAHFLQSGAVPSNDARQILR